MSCRKEEFVKGQHFHIYNRSVANLRLFKNDDDYLYFINKIKPNIIKYQAAVFAYCLMPNHFHFLLRQNSDKPVYLIFNDLNNSYVQYFNKKYSRTGHVYQGSLQHKRVRKERYLIALCQYIHYNPKEAELVNNLSEWKYSNYLEWIGQRKESLFNDELLKTFFVGCELYRQRIKEYEIFLKNNEFTELLFD
ncbi:MAG: transposase [bacterium]